MINVVYYIRVEEEPITGDFKEWLNEKREKVKKYFNAKKVFIDVVG
jgi:hypothetical protein